MIGEFDKKYAEQVGKAGFVKQHQHLASKEELEETFDELVPEKEVVKEVLEAEVTPVQPENQ